MRILGNSLLSLGMVSLMLSWGSAQAVVIDTVTVANPGNPGDGFESTVGSVSYEYQIGKYEITAGQYTEFLNAVAATDSYGLYQTAMSSAAQGCKIQQSGSPGSFTYSVAADYADRPVNVISWGAAARFANWMHNGQPTGAQDLTTTEDGSYTLNGANTDAALLAVTRTASATWVIPSDNEWYKAAYHKNDGVTGNYWLLPTQAGGESIPGRDLTEATNPGNNANYYGNGVPYPIDGIYYTTKVGEFELSDSAYGTFDQGGNVFEWVEALQTGDTERGVRGSGWGSSDYRGMWSEWQSSSFTPNTYRTDFGVRLVKLTLSPPAVPGDFDADGDVDGADFVAWQTHFPTATGATLADGDADGDGDVDGADFVVWQTNFPFTPGPGIASPVPEPGSVILAMLGVVSLAGAGTRMRRKS